MRTGRPKKDPAQTFPVMLRVRVTQETDDLVRQAAESAASRKGTGDLSSWIRETLTAAAKRELARGDRTL